MEKELSLKKTKQVKDEYSESKIQSRWIIYDIIFFLICEVFVISEFKTDNAMLPIVISIPIIIFIIILIIKEKHTKVSNYLWLISIILSILIIGFVSLKMFNAYNEYLLEDSYIQYKTK